MTKTIAAMLGAGVVAGLAQGCALPDASKFRDPIPQQGDAQIAVAGSQVGGGAGGTTGQSAQVRLTGLGGGGTNYASLYEFTRQITDGVDTGTFGIIAAIAAVTSYPPSSVDDKQATWGPGGDSLDPINWKVVVKEVGDHEFDYEVDGRPHGSSSDSDFKAIVSGHGYGKSHPSYRSGKLTVYGDVMAALDPTRSNGGTAQITYDARGWPKTVTADITTSDGTGQWYDATVSHGEDGSGVLVLTALADVSSTKDGTNESVDEKSRWESSGAGRADVKMSGGDFGSKTVQASQCWGSTFAQVYYTDNVDYQPTAGSASACAFAQAEFDQ